MPPKVRRDGDVCEKCSRTEPRLDKAPEGHKEVLQAARALFEAGITKEDIIYRTIVCAAWASEDKDFRQMRDSTLRAGEQSEHWGKMQRRFANAFVSLDPWSIQNGVLMVRRPPVDVWAVEAEDGSHFKEVLVEVRDRSASGRDVTIQYEKCLSRFDLSYITGRAVLAYVDRDDCLQMLARPEQETSFHPELKYQVRPRKEQDKFPDPCDVGQFYEMLRANGYPKGRGGGSPPKNHNLISACAAWYLGARDAVTADNTERHRLLADVEALIANHVLRANPEAVPIKTRSTLKRDVVAAAPQIKSLEAQIREGRVFLNTNLEDLCSSPPNL